MGILRNRSINRIPIRIEECVENEFADDYANYLFDSDLSDSDNHDEEVNEVPKVPLNQCGPRRKKAKSYRPIEIVDGLPIKRNMGAQKWRRVENTKLLTSFADTQDICFDGSDLIPETISAFSRLLRDEAKMKIWNEFLEKDETEQKKMILHFEYEILKERGVSKTAGRSLHSVAQYNKKNGDDASRPDNCSPSVGKSADCCFQRLDKKFRDCLLKRRSVQFDYLYKMEFILRQFFGESSADVYAEEIISRIKRFHLHAVAQFLQLNSKSKSTFLGNYIKSMDGENCAKIVHVRNEANRFCPPDVYLATLLKNKRKNNIAMNDEWEDEF